MRIAIPIALVLVALAVALSVDQNAVIFWASEQQRSFQNYMAGAIRRLQSGDVGAYWTLLGGAGAYGFVHAVGPGHGKYLIGGVGLGTSIQVGRLLVISLASSLAQSLWAIIIVYGGFAILEVSAHQMTDLAQDVLAPASYLAIAGIGLILIWRAVRQLRHHLLYHSGPDHDPTQCNCHAHGPSPEAAAKAVTARDAVGLILSVAIRPCTGAIFLLVIAWQMDIRAAGAAAAIVMGLGTASLTSLVAVSSIAARGLVWASSRGSGGLAVATPVIQGLVGIVVVWLSLALAEI